ncbi:methyl-accepting chemotaxis protein [Limimonas halophila]|uniref:Methyl-accepting chemotaxis protein n=1 Tax=Limimonas halophila TaxID=1082479 RepID=A0A1G7KZK9_9PROT|nr:methyl-accepting chemotaxis protein [Limimonas halophila]SDF42712.1 methyl-accepting chemotaxis protein [Limimonas halophila]
MAGVRERLANVRIGNKIASIIVLLAALAVVATWLGVRGVNNTAQATKNLYDHPFKVSNALGNLRTALLSTSDAMLVLTAGDVDADREAVRERVAEDRKQIAAAIDTLHARYLGEKQDISRIENTVQAYRDVVERTLSALDNGNREQARKLYAGQGRETFQAAYDSVDKLLQFARNMAKKFLGDSMAERDSLVWRLIGLTAGMLLVGAVLAVLVSRSITRPLTRLRDQMSDLARGNHGFTVAGTRRRDETGQMAQAVEVFREQAEESDRLKRENEEKERQAQEERKQAMNELAQRFEREVGEIVQQVSSSAQQLQGTAETMSNSASTTSERVQAVGSSAEQASSNVQTVASAAQQLTNSIDEVGSRINQQSETARAARQRADGAREQVQSLAQAADQIGGVIQQIQDIAEKTNLLALNATIEAARAGEAGKGFAVVADEVKSLANQTQKATEDISERIKTVQNETSEAVSVIEAVADNMREIDEAASSIASAVEEQTSSTREISRNVEEASTGVQDVSTQLGDIGDTASQAGTASNDLLSAASSLSRQADTLSTKVDGFLKEVRNG